jgi:hypothetical protein
MYAAAQQIGSFGLSPGQVPADVSECPPNDNSDVVPVPNPIGGPISGDTRCVAGQLFNTRGRLVPSCLTNLKDMTQSYEPSECGKSNQRQIEYIAQARAIARLNEMQMFPSKTGINANLQWEVGLPNSESPSSPLRADIVIYDRNDPAVPVQIIEVKGEWNRDYDRTFDQIQGYLGALRSKIGSQYNAVEGSALNGTVDTFRVHFGQCLSTNEPIYGTYSVTTNEIAGMLVVQEIKRTPCPDLVPIPLKRPDISDRDLRFDDQVDSNPVLVTPDGEGEAAPKPFDPATVLVAAQASAQILATSMQCRAQCEDFFKTLAIGSGEARQNIEDFLTNGFRGRVWGDPHLVTLDGLSYDLQSVGEFDLINAPSWDFNVQARFTPLGTKVSMLSSLAFKLNEHTVEFNGNTLLVDHTPTTIPDGSYLYFDRGAALIHKDGKFLAVWPGQTFRPMMLFGTGVSPTFSIPPGTATTGLLGNNNGSKTDEFALRDGTPLGASPSQSVIHGPFASSWRITDQTSDFTYAPGESTATYTDPTFPSNVVKVSDFTAPQISDASATCTQLGILRGPQFDACLYDMLVVGDVQFAAAAADPGNQVGVHSSGVGSDGKLTVGFDDNVPANFSNTFLSADPATSTYAGPITDRSGYGFSIPDIPAHTSAKITFDLLAIGSWNGDATDQTVALKVDGNQVWQTKFTDTGNSADPVLTADGLGAPKLTGTLASGLPFSIFTASVTLNHQASQLRADFTTSGLSSASMKVMGLDNIGVEMQLVPPQTFDVTLPASVSDGVPGPGAGNLETGVSSDQYRFTVPSGGQSVFLAVGQTCPSYVRWALKNTTTGATPASGYCWQGNKELDNLPGGAYVLEWTGTSNASGPYSFQLMPVTVDAFDVTLPVSVSNGVPAAGAGNLETVGAHDQYRFAVPAGGQSVYLADQGCPSYLQWTLTNTTTGLVPATGYCWQGNKELDNLPAGAYVLEWTGTSNASGPYAFQLLPVTVDAFDVTLPVSVSNGVPAAGAGNLETAGAHDQYRFTVPAGGQTVFLADQGCPSYLQWTLTNTTTGLVPATGYCWQGNKQIDNLQAGTYVLEWTGTNNASGPYSFQLMPVTVDAFDITLPVSVSNGTPAAGAGNLETTGAHDQYRFTVPAGGQSVFLADQGCPDYMKWTLTNAASNIQAATGLCWQGNKQIDNLPSGPYVLEWAGTSNVSGSYAFQLMPVSVDAFDITLPASVSNGTPAAGAGNLETTGAHDQYRFTVPAGGQSVFLATGQTCPTYLQWTLKNATTGTMFGSGYCWQGNKELDNLPAGAYVLEWTGTNNASGAYAFQLMPVTVDAFDVTLPVSVSNAVPGAGAGNLETVGAHDQYRFTVPAGGQSVFLATGQTCPTYLQWTLKNTTTGTTAGSGYCFAGNKELDNLPAGAYVLEWTGTNNASGPYAFQLMPVTVDAFDVTLPVSVSNGVPGAGAGNLETVGAHDQYRFTVPAGGQSVLLHLNTCPSYLQWTLKNTTTGTTAASGYGFGGDKQLNSLPAGAYVLEWVGTNNNSGTYSFDMG